MSSLEGALGSPSTSRKYRKHEDHPMDQDSDGDEMDLFGDDDVEEHPARRPSPTPSGSERLASPEREHRQALEYEEDEAPPEMAYQVTEAQVSFPNIPLPRSSDGDKWVIRTPNFVSVDSKPYHSDTYMGPEQEDEDLASTSVKERSMSIKLKVENTIRWRWSKDELGTDRQQSNARVIRWSDGSMSLRLGKELFDITKSVDTSAGAPRQLGGSQSQQPQPSTAAVKNQGLTYLVAQHKRSQVLQAEAVVTGNMTLRPTGMQSETHRMLVRAVGQKHNKVARLKMVDEPTEDPERAHQELVRQSNKKTKRREKDEGSAGVRKRRYSRHTANNDVWSDDDEDDDLGIMGSGDEDGSPRKHRRGLEENVKEYQQDGFVVSDEEEDEYTYSSRKKRRANEEEDALERLDAKIEAQQRGHNNAESEEEQHMDVESEEDEDAPVRPAAGTRRRVVNHDDDDDEE